MLNKLFDAIRGNLKNLDVRPEKLTSPASIQSSTPDDSFETYLKDHLPIIDIACQKRSPNKKPKPKVQRDYSKNNYRVIKEETRNMNNEIVDVYYDAYRIYSTGGQKHVSDEAEIKWAVSQTFKRRKR